MKYKGKEIEIISTEIFEAVIRERKYGFSADDAFTYYVKRKKKFPTVEKFLKEFNEAITKAINRQHQLAHIKGEPKLWKTPENYRMIDHRLAVNAKPTKKRKPKPKVAKPKKEKHPWIPYDEQLKDPRCYAFRKKVFALKGHKCALCGTIENLQIHHPKYSGDYSKYAWEYDPKYMVVLCYDCHMKIHEALERNKSQAS